MQPEDQGSISRWILDLKAGDAAAAQPLWDRYFERLVRLARARIRAAPRPTAEADEEDAALSAFENVCAGAMRGQFSQLVDRDNLWRLLVVVTARKVQAQARRQRRQKRGGGLIHAEAAHPDAFEGSGADGLDRIVGDEPTPEFAAMVAEECRVLLDALGDESLRLVALARMEGCTNDEIARRFGCARRTVARRLDLIRKIWLATVA